MMIKRFDEVNISTSRKIIYDLNVYRFTRREFLKLIGFTALSIGAGVGFAGCSEQNNAGFKPSVPNPLNTGYKLIYPDWTKPVPDDVVPHIIEIGRKYIHVFAPGYLAFGIENGEVLAYDVTKDNTIVYYATVDPRFSWLIGDVDTAADNLKDINLKYSWKRFGKICRFCQ